MVQSECARSPHLMLSSNCLQSGPKPCSCFTLVSSSSYLSIPLFRESKFGKSCWRANKLWFFWPCLSRGLDWLVSRGPLQPNGSVTPCDLSPEGSSDSHVKSPLELKSTEEHTHTLWICSTATSLYCKYYKLSFKCCCPAPAGVGHWNRGADSALWRQRGASRSLQ